ncbi:MAG: AtpZ/AtpI family protein [Ferruginibacter sp.]|nr:AtpZ/AtpI family protein [Ferruginibacter sp.]
MKQDADKSKTDSFSKQIAAKEKRKLKALGKKNNVWFGLGVMGMIGWSVVVPALAGALSGVWLDKRYPQTFSWTLTLLIAGLITGSVIAWYWIEKEDKAMHSDKEEDDE